MLIEASAECRDKGYHLVAEPIDIDDDLGSTISRAIRRLRPDGIMLTPPICDNPVALAAIEETGLPVARIAAGTGGYGTVVHLDDRPVCRQLVEHLISLGHRRIAMITPQPEHRVAGGRYLGYCDALSANGLPVCTELIVSGDFTFLSGAAAAEQLLALSDPPSAIFAANDEMALGVMSALRRRGLRIPEDVAVAGFDDTPRGSNVLATVDDCSTTDGRHGASSRKPPKRPKSRCLAESSATGARIDDWFDRICR